MAGTIFKVNAAWTSESQLPEGYTWSVNAFNNMADAAKKASTTEKTVIQVQGEDPAIVAGSAFGGGQNVSITGTASFDWNSGGWMFIGRDASQGDVTKTAVVTFDNANITSKPSGEGGGDHSINISGAKKDSTTVGYGCLDIINNSNVATEWVVNKNILNVNTGSTFTATTALNVAGRPASETPDGKDYTAVLNIDAATVNAKGADNSAGLVVGSNEDANGKVNLTNHAVLNAKTITAVENKSVINVTDSTIAVEGTFDNKGTVTVTGSSKLSAATYTGNLTVGKAATATEPNATTITTDGFVVKGKHLLNLADGSTVTLSGNGFNLDFDDDDYMMIENAVEEKNSWDEQGKLNHIGNTLNITNVTDATNGFQVYALYNNANSTINVTDTALLRSKFLNVYGGVFNMTGGNMTVEQTIDTSGAVNYTDTTVNCSFVNVYTGYQNGYNGGRLNIKNSTFDGSDWQMNFGATKDDSQYYEKGDARDAVVTLNNSTLKSSELNNAGTINMDAASKIVLTASGEAEYAGVYNKDDAAGCITVDMTGASEYGVYKLIDAADTETSNYGIAGINFKFADGKDNDYTLSVKDNDLYAIRVDMSSLAVNAAWSDKKYGDEVTVGEGTSAKAYYYGITAYSQMADAIRVVTASNLPVSIAVAGNGNVGATETVTGEGTEFTVAGTYNVSGTEWANLGYLQLNPDKTAGLATRYVLNIGAEDAGANLVVTKPQLRASSDLNITDSHVDFTMQSDFSKGYLFAFKDSTVTVKNSVVGYDHSQGNSSSVTAGQASTGGKNGMMSVYLTGVFSADTSTVFTITNDSQTDAFSVYDRGLATFKDSVLYSSWIAIGKYETNRTDRDTVGRDDEIATLSLDNSKVYSNTADASGLTVGDAKAGKLVMKNGSLIDYTGINATINTNGTVEIVNSAMKVNSITNSGTITVDMTAGTKAIYKLIDAADTETSNYGTAGINFKFAADKDNGYELKTYNNDLYAVKKTSVTITVDNKEKVYDGMALEATCTLTEGVLSGDDQLVVTYDNESITDVDTKTVTVTNYQIMRGTENVTDEYTALYGTFTKVAGSLTVTPRTLTVSGTTVADKHYDGTTTATVTAGTLKNAVSGDDVAIDTVSGTFADKNAGTDKNVTVAYTLKGAKKDNYTLSSETITADIDKRAVTLTSGDAIKQYDKKPLTNPKVEVTGDGFLQGEGATYDFTGSQTEIGSSKNSFTYTLNEGTDAVNYDITKVEGDLIVVSDDTKVVTDKDLEQDPSTGSVALIVTDTETKDVAALAVEGHIATVKSSSDNTVAVKTVTANGGSATIESFGSGAVTVGSVSGKDVNILQHGSNVLGTTDTINAADTIKIVNDTTDHKGMISLGTEQHTAGTGLIITNETENIINGGYNETTKAEQTANIQVTDGDTTINNKGHINANVKAGGAVKITNTSANTLIGAYTGTSVTVDNNDKGVAENVTLTATDGDVTVTSQADAVINGATISTTGNVSLNGAGTANNIRITSAASFSNELTTSFAGTISCNVTNSGSLTWQLKNSAMIYGNLSSTGTLTIDAANMKANTYTLVSGTFADTVSFTVKNDTESASGLTLANSVELDGCTYSLSKVADTLKLTIGGTGSQDIKPASLTVDGTKANPVTLQYSLDSSFDTYNQVSISKTNVENYLNGLYAGKGTLYYRYGTESSWTKSGSISCGTEPETPKVYRGTGDGNADVFFARTTETFTSGLIARNVGIKGDSSFATSETVSLKSKNSFNDLYLGGMNANILYLTDTENGDALFLDNIYSAFPTDYAAQARLGQISEIRAGDGSDLIDMTSQRYEYVGEDMTIRGGDGDDIIWANKGNNKLFGDAGNDTLYGATGNDVIVGGSGNDTMRGNGGDDIFTFHGDFGNDTVYQCNGGTVTLWFDEGNISKWDEVAMTYTDGDNSVKVSGVTKDDVTLKFGDDSSDLYDVLVSVGAFEDASSTKLFTTKEGQGIIAQL